MAALQPYGCAVAGASCFPSFADWNLRVGVQTEGLPWHSSSRLVASKVWRRRFVLLSRLVFCVHSGGLLDRCFWWIVDVMANWQRRWRRKWPQNGSCSSLMVCMELGDFIMQLRVTTSAAPRSPMLISPCHPYRHHDPFLTMVVFLIVSWLCFLITFILQSPLDEFITLVKYRQVNKQISVEVQATKWLYCICVYRVNSEITLGL